MQTGIRKYGGKGGGREKKLNITSNNKTRKWVNYGKFLHIPEVMYWVVSVWN